VTSDQVFALFLLFIGFLLGVIPGIVRHGFRMMGHCCATSDVIDEICTDATTYLEDNVMSPLYRTAAEYYNQSFETLMFSGGLHSDELNTLLRFGSQVNQFNRGLDQVHEVSLAMPGSDREIDETKRLRIKALELISQKEAVEYAEKYKLKFDKGDTRYDAVRASIDQLKDVPVWGWIWRQITQPKSP